ncbi:MAG TPA: pilin assembly protein, partial [Gammaproteobacteria bacterium]|nr:pilin assembly protein [Gammaproteobacteria bacterium]
GAVQTAVVGNYLGQNYGKIISIDENKIVVEEQVLNSAGTWVGRDASIKVDR